MGQSPQMLLQPSNIAAPVVDGGAKNCALTIKKDPPSQYVGHPSLFSPNTIKMQSAITFSAGSKMWAMKEHPQLNRSTNSTSLSWHLGS